MRTAQLVMSAVAFALAVGAVALMMNGVWGVQGLESAVLETSFALLPPLWCLAAGVIARPVGWKPKAALLVISGLVLYGTFMIVEAAYTYSHSARSVGRLHYVFQMGLDCSLLVMVPLGLLSLVIAWKHRVVTPKSPD